MVIIVYAHEPEVKALKKLVFASDFRHKVVWLRRNLSDGNIFEDAESDLIVNPGFAGRLNSALNIGEVVLVRNFACAVAERFADDRQLKSASLVTSDKPVLDAQGRAALDDTADIVDMEAHVLNRMAADAGIPFASFKLVSDNADAEAWDSIKRNMGRWSERLGAVVFEFLQVVLEDENIGHHPGP